MCVWIYNFDFRFFFSVKQVHFQLKLCALLFVLSVEAMLREDDTTSLRVFRAGFVPPLVDDAVTVTRLDKATSDLLPQEPSFYRHISNDVDDDDSYKFVAQQTPVDNDSLFSSVSFALTGQWIRCDPFRFIWQQ